jgi:hypothetical protein
MAFVSESERKMNDIKMNPVGPGAYFSEMDSPRQR